MERYEVLRDIGTGNLGVAKLVRDVKTSEHYAVKLIERGNKLSNGPSVWVLKDSKEMTEAREMTEASELDTGEQGEATVDIEAGVVASIRRRLVELPGKARTYEPFTIFRVPGSVRERARHLYEPTMVAIGPYHRGDVNLRAMEAHKWRYLRDLLSRRRENSLEQCVGAIRALEPRARRCYAEDTGLGSKDFIEMLLLDGCFIIELMIKMRWRNRETMLRLGWSWPHMQSDLLKLENQIPFFVLEALYHLLRAQEPDGSRLPELAAHYLTMGKAGKPGSLLSASKGGETESLIVSPLREDEDEETKEDEGEETEYAKKIPDMAKGWEPSPSPKMREDEEAEIVTRGPIRKRMAEGWDDDHPSPKMGAGEVEETKFMEVEMARGWDDDHLSSEMVGMARGWDDDHPSTRMRQGEVMERLRKGEDREIVTNELRRRESWEWKSVSVSPVGKDEFQHLLHFYYTCYMKLGMKPRPSDQPPVGSDSIMDCLIASWCFLVGSGRNVVEKAQHLIFRLYLCIISWLDARIPLARNACVKVKRGIFWLCPCLRCTKPQRPTLLRTVPCAKELEQAGVKFRKKASSKKEDPGDDLNAKELSGFLHINFSGGTMEIPQLPVYDQTKVILTNLVAFEQCNVDPKKELYITSYAFLMDGLVNTEKDVAVLQKCGILVNNLPSDEDLATFFNQLCESASLNPNQHYYKDLTNKVWEYYESSWPRQRANLKRDYFSNPWAILSVLAALILLGLAMLQTFFAVFAYFRPPPQS